MHIYFAPMYWRDCSALHADSVLRLAMLCKERGIGFTNGAICGDALVSRAQSIAASNFVRSDADVMLTCGSDTIFEPDEAIAMCTKAKMHSLIGAVVMKRYGAPYPACPIPEGDLLMENDQEPVETWMMGSGFTAYHRRIFDQLVPQMVLCRQNVIEESFWYFFQPIIIPDDREVWLPLSEDWSLAWRAKQLGYKCWIDPTVRVRHLATAELTIEDMARPPKPAETAVMLRADADGNITVLVPEEAIA